jgi:hypothetical protein
VTKPLFDSPTGGPTLGPVPGSEFGNDRGDHDHGGCDLNCARRHPIRSGRRGGRVLFVGPSTGVGGNKVSVDYGRLRDGNQHTLTHYHFGEKGSPPEDSIIVRVGQRLRRGQIIGYAGDSGNALAVHDHLEHLVNGMRVDPLQFLREYQVTRRPKRLIRYALLYPGSVGPDTVALQDLLRVAGFDPGRSDGVYGPLTLAAVLAFQKARGLKADGIVGKLTWNALLKGGWPMHHPQVERWRNVVEVYWAWTGEPIDYCLQVMWGESQGVVGATNPGSGAAGLWQHMPPYWAWRVAEARKWWAERGVILPDTDNIYDPELNTAVAAWLWTKQGWGAWEATNKYPRSAWTPEVRWMSNGYGTP